ncbi:hypothetical protein KUTeg_005847 [Tegillarca granosa]|uniref:Uncharacterized protein n=1 Tax=Tegillarca granosa TaxID=220873 RepID=A0ABQ9FK07_TEGGR|nr:hypothetical protein KUTeg_005847 [Tegillarca granosa]
MACFRVHRQFYRLPENASQVAKILHSLDYGMIASFKGKDFNEIEFKAENVPGGLENETI